jgi:hypothetical protein
MRVFLLILCVVISCDASAAYRRFVENLINTTATSKGWSDRPSGSEKYPRSESWENTFNWTPFASGDGVNTLSGANGSTGTLTSAVTTTGRAFYSNTYQLVAGRIYSLRVNVSAVSGTTTAGTANLKMYSTGATGTIELDLNATGEYIVTWTQTVTEQVTCRFGAGLDSNQTAAKSISLDSPMLEDITAISPRVSAFHRTITAVNDGGYTITSNQRNSDAVTFAPDPRGYTMIIGDSQTNGRDEMQGLAQDIMHPRFGSTIRTRGTAGEKLAVEILARFSTELDLDPFDQVVIEGGVNDIIGGASLATMQAALQSLVATARARGVYVAAVIDVGPWKSFASWSAGLQTATDAWNAWLVTYCAQERIRLIKPSEMLEGAADTLQSQYDSGDGLHYSITNGMRRVAMEIVDAIAPGADYNGRPAAASRPAATRQ